MWHHSISQLPTRCRILSFSPRSNSGFGLLPSVTAGLFSSIQYSDAKPITLNMGNSECGVRLYGFDFETTGLFHKGDRVIEIGVRDLLGEKKSCFGSLVNPGRNVPNSNFHGITTDMVNQPHVPRMKELIPIMIKFVNSRQEQPGEIALFVGHNSRRFDVPFLKEEFKRCSMNIPENWRFYDNLPLSREYMKMKRRNGSVSSKSASLQALGLYFQIPLVGSAHRAMSDVNLLALVLERITSDMNLTVSDLLETSFGPADLDHSNR